MKYIAFLRGIGPGNPHMHNNKLRGVFEDLGFTGVKSVISSGNIIFESENTDTSGFEAQLEKAWPEKLGFTSSTIIRSQEQLEKIVVSDPFKDLQHTAETYLLVTFLKHPADHTYALPYNPEGKHYEVVAAAPDTIFTVVDTSTGKTPDVMAWLEKTYGKEISSRTFLTCQRILTKMQSKQPPQPL